MSHSHDKEILAKISRIEKLLEEIIVWTKVGNLKSLRDILAQELDSQEKMRIFELTDGINTQQEIASRVKISRSTISYYWQKWYRLGILTHSARAGRMKKIVSLEEVGINPPRAGEKPKESEVLFQPQDLRKILNSPEMFSTNQELADFSYNIFPDLKGGELPSSREKLIDSVLKAFEDSDNLKRALFMQALERRASLSGDPQFRKYFEEWEKRIGE